MTANHVWWSWSAPLNRWIINAGLTEEERGRWEKFGLDRHVESLRSRRDETKDGTPKRSSLERNRANAIGLGAGEKVFGIPANPFAVGGRISWPPNLGPHTVRSVRADSKGRGLTIRPREIEIDPDRLVILAWNVYKHEAKMPFHAQVRFIGWLRAGDAPGVGVVGKLWGNQDRPSYVVAPRKTHSIDTFPGLLDRWPLPESR